MVVILGKYASDQTVEKQGSKTTTGIVSCFVNYLPKGTALEGNSNGDSSHDWRKFGLIDGDAPQLENVLKSFQNMTGMITRMVDNQLTGRGGAKTVINLKNLTEDAINRSHGGAYDPVIGLYRYPGTRQYVSAFSGAFVADN